MGTLLNGRYELGEAIGTGGMGRVHRATDTRLGRSVAIKILRVGGGEDDTTARARFKAEATLAGSLHHPGIAQVYDVGEDESSPEHEPFIVMQLIEGTPLSRLLAERGAIPADGVAKLVGQVADALETAHLAGIVHRDLKPSNIVVTPQGRAVLVDFGIAWSAGSEPLTATGSIIGTAEYFSPEQAAGRPATARSDLYSLGIVAYHCLTGVSPFRRDTAVATAMAQLTTDLPPLDDSVPAALRTLITSLTQKEPDDRPSSAAIVASLANAETSPATQIVPPVTSAIPPAAQATTVQPAAAAPPPPPTAAPTAPVAPPVLPPPSGADERERRSSHWIVLAVIAVLLVLAAVLGAQALGGDDDPADPGSTTATSDSPTDDPTPSETPEPTQSSEEPDDVTVDRNSLIGLTYDDAADQLKQLGLSVRREEETSPAPAGTVTGVSPSGSVEPGSTVILTVAKEAPETTAPPSETTPTEPADDAGPAAGGPGDKKDDKGPKKP
ncbi:serine/threonine-protein kinase [Aeromicrobium fastidiosum]|uniref:non-specific serine/threonine protein kinase n=1 Tax=Aeromicrobium fastidiosum TaxID=52699 RepID=A0A641AKJ4_9ACTN|nr:serine/threonine-protein kinase [Aeromicrobium fastidiosum]KAA1374945.1 protein kinase [Aeromicrobium fastidiosum]MBP2390481.1 serine/threonine-protein kinase [Aeromicrobium fastidiosum]